MSDIFIDPYDKIAKNILPNSAQPETELIKLLQYVEHSSHFPHQLLRILSAHVRARFTSTCMSSVEIAIMETRKDLLTELSISQHSLILCTSRAQIFQ
uniref:Uncharacterized protein n=1 Tax=Arundo donax TaxID=35708 RepID=A0A0A9ETU9_ARUDO